MIGTLCLLLCVCAFHGQKTAPERQDGTDGPPIETPAEELAADTASANTQTEEKEPDGGGYYILKAYLNRIAVYRVFGEGTRALIEIVDMDVRSLPAEDVKSLETGIVVYSKEALVRLLEDFTS